MNNISYVIPTLNSAATLDMTLLSLRSQKDVNVNITVVDSGSTDSTLDICKRWDVKILYAEPGNMYHAINIGLQQCDTEWLGYINSDDWLYPNSVSRLITVGNETQADLVYGNCDYTDEYGRFIYSMKAVNPNDLLSLSKMKVLGFAQQTTIFRQSLYKEIGGFNDNSYFCADAEFYFQALLKNYKFSFLSGASVACFRIHSNQLSNVKKESMAKEKKLLGVITGKANIWDLPAYFKWRFNNIPHYLLRILRQSLLLGQLTMNKSLQPLSYKN